MSGSRDGAEECSFEAGEGNKDRLLKRLLKDEHIPTVNHTD